MLCYCVVCYFGLYNVQYTLRFVEKYMNMNLGFAWRRWGWGQYGRHRNRDSVNGVRTETRMEMTTKVYRVSL